ncbi:hypothetical protein FHS18_006783 [Paenibacillus phyllosphaerae]|uniref:DUF2508 domain-containing protein n=1 Tax=Paenibacillus phyllosphaerae TaxID=274593 RepID=A0A7W5FRR5_9BACL|nr:YaaL family protein [Paenibacillus phyllosphaerae]MBB3114643.1 hypothetical protein [Paenibacillus phyllosphaerae]
MINNGLGLQKDKPLHAIKVSTSQTEAQSLLEEIRVAKQDWDNALRHFEYALGKDQIDYAIFAIEAAEKRYEMLLRKAKAMNIAWPRWNREGLG